MGDINAPPTGQGLQAPSRRYSKSYSRLLANFNDQNLFDDVLECMQGIFHSRVESNTAINRSLITSVESFIADDTSKKSGHRSFMSSVESNRASDESKKSGYESLIASDESKKSGYESLIAGDESKNQAMNH